MFARLTRWLRGGRKGRPGWIGVDVGAATVKVAEVQVAAEGSSLLRTLVVPRESVFGKADWAGESALLPSLARNRLKNRGGIFDPVAAACLSMSAVDLRAVSVPQTSEDELGALIEQELQIGDDSGEARQFDWWDRPTSGNVDLKHAYALSASERLTTRLGESLMETGVIPHSLDGVPHALARAVSLVWEPETPVGILDWGHSTATFVVALRSQPVFVRVLRSCGLANWHQTISQAFEVPRVEADHLLREHGVPDPRATGLEDVEELLANIVRPLQQQLHSELKRTMHYLRTESPCPSPGRLVLFGGGAVLPNAVSTLEAHLAMPVSTWEIPDARGEFTGLGPLVGVAAGLSMLGLNGGGTR